MRRDKSQLFDKQLLATLGLIVFSCCPPLCAEQWQPYPSDLPVFNFDGDRLADNWEVLQRATVQQYPSTDWVKQQLSNEAMCEETLRALTEHADFSTVISEGEDSCDAIDRDQVAAILQQAWRDYFTGNYQSAVQAGEALGPIGYPVGGYARIVYGQVLPRSPEEKKAVLEKAIDLAEEYAEIQPDSAYSWFVSAYSMGRIMEDLSMTGALKTGYNSIAKEHLEKLIQEYPNHTKGAANYGGYNAGIIGKSGRFLGRLSYGATPEKMESGFATAMKVEPPVVSNHIEYAIALERVYGKDEVEKARKTLENLISVKPLDAEEALELRRVKKLLADIGTE